MKLISRSLRRKLVLIVLFPPLYSIVILFRFLPLELIRNFATFVGYRFYLQAKKSRETALANLQYVYGNKLTEEERIHIARCVFTEMIMSFFDYMAFSHITDKERFFSLIEVHGEEHLKKAYEQRKGVICLMPHLSSWEFAAITPPMLGYETSCASKAMKQQLIENMMNKYRRRRGLKNITRQGSYAKLVEVLQKGECLVLMIDQDTKVKSVFVDFFGRSAYTPVGASRLALDTGALIVPMMMTRKQDGNYQFIIYPELPIVKTGDLDKDLYENTLCQTKAMEKMISAYKDQWVWMHPRWKTTIDDVEKYYKCKKQEAV